MPPKICFTIFCWNKKNEKFEYGAKACRIKLERCVQESDAKEDDFRVVQLFRFMLTPDEQSKFAEAKKKYCKKNK